LSETSTSNTLLAYGLGLTAALATLLGGLFIARREWSDRVLKYFIALGSGFMLAAAFLEMIPESLRLVARESAAPDVEEAAVRVLVWVLGGYLLVHLFEHTLAPHFHFGEETHLEEMARAHAGYTALLGLSIHAFFDGVAIGSGFLVSAWLGGIIFLAVALHKLPEGFAVASVMLACGQGRRVALGAAGALGAATLLGVMLIHVLKAQVSYALPISAGVTLYVAASDLIPEVNKEPGVKMAIVVFIGVALMAALHFSFHGGHS
jgi:ZIP family zinc transporter/zinc and cadmium transporter